MSTALAARSPQEITTAGDTAAVGGLLIVRDPGARESYSVIHTSSGVPVVLGLAGPGSAIGALLDIVSLTDWTLSAKQLVAILAASPDAVAGIERAAAKWGGTTVPERPVYAS